MLRRFLPLLMLAWAVLAGTVRAQHYFNKRETLNGFASVFTGLVEKEGRFYICGITIDSSNHVGGGTFNFCLGIKFAAFDSAGGLFYDTVFQRPKAVVGTDSARHLGVWSTPLRRTPSGDGFIVAAESIDSWGNLRSAILILDSLGVPAMRREYERPAVGCVLTDSNLNFFVTRDLKPDGQGGWLMLSSIGCSATPTGYESNTLLSKLDSSFNPVWHHLYGGADGRSDYARKLLIEEDGYLLLCLDEETTFADNQAPSYHVQMYKVDTGGNVMWEYTSADTIWKEASDVMRTADGGYLWCGNDGTKDMANPVNPQPRYRPRIEKLDSNRATEWAIYTQGLRTDKSGNLHMRLLPDGDVAVAGAVSMFLEEGDSSRFSRYGTLAKIDPTSGAIRWQRRYRSPHDTTTNTLSTDYHIYDLQPTSDGGYILVGMANDLNGFAELPNQRGWIIKVDSAGCLGPDDPQCKEAPASIFTFEAGKKDIAVYPNPASDVLAVRYPVLEDDQAIFEVSDLTGRKVMHVRLNAQAGEQTIDVAALHSGTYLWRVNAGAKELAHGKWTKL